MASGIIKISQSQGLLTVPYTVDNLTVSASTYGTQNIDVERAGFTPLGVIGFTVSNATTGGTNSSWFSVRTAYIFFASEENKHYAQINYRNHGTNQAKVRVVVIVLYTKN